MSVKPPALVFLTESFAFINAHSPSLGVRLSDLPVPSDSSGMEPARRPFRGLVRTSRVIS